MIFSFFNVKAPLAPKYSLVSSLEVLCLSIFLIRFFNRTLHPFIFLICFSDQISLLFSVYKLAFDLTSLRQHHLQYNISKTLFDRKKSSTMKTFVALVAISSLASMVNADCPVYPPCSSDETTCMLGPFSTDGCPPAPLCIPSTSKYWPHHPEQLS